MSVDRLSNCLLSGPASQQFQVAAGVVSGMYGSILDKLPDSCGSLAANAW